VSREIKLGKLVHLGFDALLISTFLAGVKRTTGLTPALSQAANKDVRQLLRSYLEFGSISSNSTLAGEFGLTHSCARGQDILRASYIKGCQRSLTPTGFKSVLSYNFLFSVQSDRVAGCAR